MKNIECINTSWQWATHTRVCFSTLYHQHNVHVLTVDSCNKAWKLKVFIHKYSLILCDMYIWRLYTPEARPCLSNTHTVYMRLSSNAPWYSCMYRLWLYMLHAAGTYSVTPVLHDSSVCADLAFIPLVATKKFVIIWPDDATHGDVQLIRGRNRYVRLSLVFFCLLLYRWY